MTRLQVDKTLASEQKRSDFQPRDDGAVSLDRPTDACTLVIALLRAVQQVATQNLHAGNLSSFLAEVCNLFSPLPPPPTPPSLTVLFNNVASSR